MLKVFHDYIPKYITNLRVCIKVFSAVCVCFVDFVYHTTIHHMNINQKKEVWWEEEVDEESQKRSV